MAIVNSGAIDPLMELMWGGSSYTKAHATAALGSVATSNAHTQEVILKRGGVALLVSLLRDGVPPARDAAAVALRNLTTGNLACQEELLKTAGVKPLVSVLKRGRSSGREGAAGALRNLAGGSRAGKQAVVAAGAVPALVDALKRGSEVPVRRAAAWALTNLAANEPEVKAMIHAEGAVKPLVELLRNSPSSSQGNGAKEAAAVRCLSSLLLSSRFVGFASFPGRPGVWRCISRHRHTATSLGPFSSDKTGENRRPLPPPAPPAAQPQSALCNLFANGDINPEELAPLGAIPALVELCKRGSEAGKETGARALWVRQCGGGVPARMVLMQAGGLCAREGLGAGGRPDRPVCLPVCVSARAAPVQAPGQRDPRRQTRAQRTRTPTPGGPT